MAFDVRKSWIKKKIVELLGATPRQWEVLLAKDGQGADEQIMSFLSSGREGETLLFYVRPSEGGKAAASRGTLHETEEEVTAAELVLCRNWLACKDHVSCLAYVLKVTPGTVDVTGKNIEQEMKRCLLAGTTEPNFIYDVLFLLEDIYLPLLKEGRRLTKNQQSSSLQEALYKQTMSPGDDRGDPEILLREDAASVGERVANIVASARPTTSADEEMQDSISSTKNFSDASKAAGTKSASVTQGATQLSIDLQGESDPQCANELDNHKTLQTRDEGRAIALSAEHRWELAVAAEKLASCVKLAVGEIYDAVVLRVPCEDVEGLADSADAHLIQAMEDAVQEWTEIVDRVLEVERRRIPEGKYPLAELDFWRERRSAVASLYEQLTLQRVQHVLSWLGKASASSSTLQHFYEKFATLQKYYIEAKDTERFLATLERHFKKLATASLKVVAEIIAPLLHSVRMMWITSRHYTADEKLQPLLLRIAKQIADRVQAAIKPNCVLHGDVAAAAKLVKEAKTCLDSWQETYMEVRRKIEESEFDRRWEFDRRKLFQKTNYMSHVCQYLLEAAEVIQQFKNLLGPELKAAIRYPKGIDALTADVQDLTCIFDALGDDGFEESSSELWVSLADTFHERIRNVEEKALLLLDTRFKKLHSAVAAFAMLKNFNTIQSRPCINAKLQEKFVEILRQFVVWARGLLQQLKRSVLQFKTMPSLFETDEAEAVFTNYLELARELTAYEESTFNHWRVKTSAAVASCLKLNVLRMVSFSGAAGAGSSSGRTKYAVNWNPLLWTIMREARCLSQVEGHEIPHSILNVALQKEKYVDRHGVLENMLENMEAARGKMTPIQLRLFQKQLQKLDK